MKFLGHDQDGSGGPEQTFNLEPGKSVTYFDVLGSVFHETSAFGAIRITSDTASLKIVSVTSTPGFGGTLSQTIPAVRSSDLIPAGSSRSILYIREGDGFRSNLVLASNASVPTTIDAALVSPAGETLASKSYSVPPNGMTQINRVVRDMGVSGSVTGARLVLSSSTPGAAFTAFASVIDEVTNDPDRRGGEVKTRAPGFFSPSRRRSPRRRAPDRASGRRTDPTAETSGPWPSTPRTPPRFTPGRLAAAVFKIHGRRRHLDGRQHGHERAPMSLAMAIDPSSPTTLYAGHWSGGVFKSTDGGGSWSAVNAGLTDTVVQALAIDPSPGHPLRGHVARAASSRAPMAGRAGRPSTPA